MFLLSLIFTLISVVVAETYVLTHDDSSNTRRLTDESVQEMSTCSVNKVTYLRYLDLTIVDTGSGDCDLCSDVSKHSNCEVSAPIFPDHHDNVHRENSLSAYNDDEYYRQYEDFDYMNVPAAHEYMKQYDMKNEEVLVGIVDATVDWTHEDLVRRMWNNPNEIPNNGIDDDKNGCIDDVHGADFSTGVCRPLQLPNADDYHGTFVAGIVAAEANNNLGIVGVAGEFNVKLVSTNIYGPGAVGASQLYALDYLLMLGVRISNHSYGCYPSYKPYSYIKMEEALQKYNHLLVTSAGNKGKDNDALVHKYPCNLSGVLCVAAVDTVGDLSYYSNYGKTTVHIGATGDVMGTLAGGGYMKDAGTSYASPTAAGVAALMMIIKPELSPLEIRETLIATSTFKHFVHNKVVSDGILNGLNAVQQVCSTASKCTASNFRTSRRDISDPTKSPFDNSDHLSDSSLSTCSSTVLYSIVFLAMWYMY